MVGGHLFNSQKERSSSRTGTGSMRANNGTRTGPEPPRSLTPQNLTPEAVAALPPPGKDTPHDFPDFHLAYSPNLTQQTLSSFEKA